MASAACARDFEESELISILDDCLQDFPNIQTLRKEQQLCRVNLARGKDVFAILPTGFGESLIFQLFPRLAKAAMKSVRSWLSLPWSQFICGTKWSS